MLSCDHRPPTKAKLADSGVVAAAVVLVDEAAAGAGVAVPERTTTGSGIERTTCSDFAFLLILPFFLLYCVAHPWL